MGILFNALEPQIVFQEVPNEVSLSFQITGCSIGCKGCHSTELWNENNGQPLTSDALSRYLDKYEDFITCVVFFGGEWQPKILKILLASVKGRGLKTCLYTGLEKIDDSLMLYLDFVKFGAWDSDKGGLNSPTTNQRFIEVKSQQLLNFKFIK